MRGSASTSACWCHRPSTPLKRALNSVIVPLPSTHVSFGSCTRAAVVHCINSGAVHRRLRDLNDEINKLIREKGHWERRIVELGGPDYAKSAPKVGVCPWQGC